jgi:signal transduction histidine kinase
MQTADASSVSGEADAAAIEKLVEARTRELSGLSDHLQALSEREKSELARKLHDELGGLLTAAKMDLSWLQARVTDKTILERLSQLGGVLDEAMDLKRRVVEGLRPSLLDHFGLPTALRTYVASVSSQAGLVMKFTAEQSCESLSKDAAIALFRVAQEGLSNIIRHAEAKTVRLDLRGGDDHCTLMLADDGKGFDTLNPRLRGSHGLMGMRQRVQSLGGRLDVESGTGSGTTLRVTIPIRKSDRPS